ncbi:MAG: hypothetical protein IPG50_34415 [Myxococcales bacterium]|nr:hypothetical protein [Myxococcales bacterium]
MPRVIKPFRGFPGGDPFAPVGTASSAVNQRTLVVGPGGIGSVPGLGALRSDFRTIGEAMSVVPLPSKKANGEVILAAPQDTWTILVTPGVYFEEIRMKPNVILVGIGQSAVIFPPQSAANWVAPPGGRGRRAVVYMNHNTAVKNLVFGKLGMTSNDYVFWNFDRYNVGELKEAGRTLAPSGLGISDVWVWPYPVNAPPPVRGGASVPARPEPRPALPLDYHKTKGKTLLMEGDWHTALFTNVGSSYWEAEGYDIEVRGVSDRLRDPHYHIADCHFTNCFFDALFIDNDPGGCMLVENIEDVHVRGSLLRVNGAVHGAPPNGRVWGSCVRGRGRGFFWLEHTSLECPGKVSDRALDFAVRTDPANEPILGSDGEPLDRMKGAILYSDVPSLRGDLSRFDVPTWPPRIRT